MANNVYFENNILLSLITILSRRNYPILSYNKFDTEENVYELLSKITIVKNINIFTSIYLLYR